MLLLGVPASPKFWGVAGIVLHLCVTSVEGVTHVWMNSSHAVALGDKGDFQWHGKGVAPWPAGAASSPAAAVAQIWE